MAADTGRIFQVVAQHRAALLRGERQAASEMVRAYGEIWGRIRGQLDLLLEAKATAEAAGEAVDAAWLFKHERLQSLQSQVEHELRGFAEFADPIITRQQGLAVDAALDHAEELTRLAMGKLPPGIGFRFNVLPTDALVDLVGFTAKGSPLRELLDGLGQPAGAAVRDALIQGVALGQGPAEIARQVRRASGMGLDRALKISRTEPLRAYRESTRRQYEANSDVVDGWVWMCALTPRTCAVCFALHGSIHPLSEQLDEHPCGRCTALPHVKSWSELGIEGVPDNRPVVTPGAEQFAALEPAAQDAILGRAGGAAYRAGALRLEDVVGQRFDPDWGSTRRVKSLREVLGAEEAGKWGPSVMAPSRMVRPDAQRAAKG